MRKEPKYEHPEASTGARSPGLKRKESLCVGIRKKNGKKMIEEKPRRSGTAEEGREERTDLSSAYQEVPGKRTKQGEHSPRKKTARSQARAELARR